MNITSAIEGRDACDALKKDLGTIRYNPDLYKMYRNIESMVTNISKLEVVCRQSRNRLVLETPLKTLNESVDHLQKLILMAKLMD